MNFLKEEHHLIRNSIQDFVKAEVEPQAHEYNKEEKFNVDLFRKLGEQGYLGVTVPEKWGGSGMDALSAVILHEELSYSDPGFCLAYLAHSMLCVNNIAVNASDAQREKYLPDLCSGKTVGCMAMSEPNAGTDIKAMNTKVTSQEAGKYSIQGQKMWITNGCLDDQGTPADIVFLYAKEQDGSISSFILEREQGWKVGQKIYDKLGMRSSNTAELVFDSTVTEEQRLGKPGASFLHMVKNLEIERVTLAAMSLGIARRCLDKMVQYSKEREAFGKPLHRFGQIQSYIANSYAEIKASQAYIYSTAASLNLEKAGNRLDTDGVKLVATTMAKTVADRAIQTLGGYGYVGEYVVERMWRDSKLLEIGGGTLEAHQKNITNDLINS